MNANDYIKRISSEFMFPEDILERVLNSAHGRQFVFKIAKRKGGERRIVQCSPELRLIQDWLSINCFSKLPVSSVSTAFSKGSSIYLNACLHSESIYSVRVDVKDFFPSINVGDLLGVTNFEELTGFSLEDGFYELVYKSCFNKDGSLPVGYSTSPLIGNLVMFEMDEFLRTSISSDSMKFGRAVLTRYADDYVFSSNKKGACKNFLSLLGATFKLFKRPSLTINNEKTRFMNKKSGSTLVTGLRIRSDGSIGVHSNYKSHIRLLMKLCSEERLDTEGVIKLRGHLSYIQSVDYRLYNSLMMKYHGLIGDIIFGEAGGIS